MSRVSLSGPRRMGRRLAPSFLAIVVSFGGLALRLHAQVAVADRTGETIFQAVARAAAAYGEGAGDLAPSRGAGAGEPPLSSEGERATVSTGTIALFTDDGASTAFDVTLIRKGDSRLQRIIHQDGVDVRLGTDGVQTWHSVSIGFNTVAVGEPLQFIESRTVRSVPSLLDHQNRGWSLSDKGRYGNARVVAAREPGGRQTDYYIDDATSMVTRLVLYTGERPDMFGNTIPATDAFLFSDFRNVDGVPTPFRVERVINGLKYEEMVFTSVSYDDAVSDDDFRP